METRSWSVKLYTNLLGASKIPSRLADNAIDAPPCSAELGTSRGIVFKSAEEQEQVEKIIREFCVGVDIQITDDPHAAGIFLLGISKGQPPTLESLESIIGDKTTAPLILCAIGSSDQHELGPIPPKIQEKYRSSYLCIMNNLYRKLDDARIRCMETLGERVDVLGLGDDRKAAMIFVRDIEGFLRSYEEAHESSNYDNAKALGMKLEDVLINSRNRFSVPLGKSEFGEGGTRAVGDAKLVLRRVERSGPWAHNQIAQQRYHDVLHFESDPSFRTAHAYHPLVYDNYSLFIVRQIDGPTIYEALRILHQDVIAKGGSTAIQRKKGKKIIPWTIAEDVSVAKALVRHHLDSTVHWIKNAPAGFTQSPREIQLMYTENLQKIPDIFKSQVRMDSVYGRFDAIWATVSEKIMSLLRYDKKNIVRYRDAMPTNSLLLIPQFTGETDRAKLLREKFFDTSPTEQYKRISAASVQIDIAYRMMHALEELPHILLCPEISWLQGYGTGGSDWVSSLTERYIVGLGFNQNCFSPSERDSMAAYRAARKMCLLVKYGKNSFDDFSKGMIDSDEHKSQLATFTDDFTHYNQKAAAYFERIFRDIGVQFRNCALSEFTELERLTRVQGVTVTEESLDAASRLLAQSRRHKMIPDAAAAVIALLYIKKLGYDMSAAGGLHYEH